MKKQKQQLPQLAKDVILIDSHCHLDMEAYHDDLQDVLLRAQNNQIQHLITIGIDLQSSEKAIQLAQRHSHISATIGVHPHDVAHASQEVYQSLGDLVERHRHHIVGYGEIGLDYFKNYADPTIQKKHFVFQLGYAKELGLPIVIHDRNAHNDILQILKKEELPEKGGVMHCYSGDLDFAKKVLDLGLYISIPGVVTFKNAQELQDVARKVPLERMLVETDSPFLSPHPRRGKRNEPTMVLYTAAKIAELRDISLEDVARQTTENCCNLFNIPNPLSQIQ